MNAPTESGENAKLSPSAFRVIGRILEIAIMGFLVAGILSLSYNAWYLAGAVLIAFFIGVGAYHCALKARPKKTKASEVEKPFSKEDRYLIDAANLEKMIADGVPWDVVGALTASSPREKKPTGITEVELIQQLVSFQCDLDRISEFRRKILKNTRVTGVIDRPSSPNTPSSDSAHAALAGTLEPSPAVRAP